MTGAVRLITVEYNEVYPPILANTPPPLLSLAQSLVPPLL